MKENSGLLKWLKKSKNKREKLEELWTKLLKLNPDNIELRIIVRGVKVLRQKAWNQFLIYKPTEKDLCYLLVFLDCKKEKSFRDIVGGIHYALFIKPRYELMKKDISPPNSDTTSGIADMNILKELERAIKDPLKKKIIKEMIELS